MRGEEGGEDERLDGHELDEDVERWPRGVLERVADGVPDHRRLVRLGALGPQRPRLLRRPGLDVLLGVVPRAAAVRRRDRHLHPGHQRAGEQPRQRLHPEQRPGDERARHHQRPRRHHLPQRRVGGDPHAGGVVRRGEPLGEPRDLVELAPHLLHHPQRRAPHAPHRHRREPVGEHGAGEEPDEHPGAHHVHRPDPRPAHVRAEQRQRHQRRRPDREPLPDRRRRVPGGVERVRALAHAPRHAGHLRDAAGVVADGAIGVDGEPRGDGAQHPQRSQRDAVHGGEPEAGVDGAGDGEDRHDHRLVPHGEAEDHVRRRPRPARLRHRLHRPINLKFERKFHQNLKFYKM
ncbi:Os05g0157000 [Oryza sativa Japonica Group]|uniref:Os05g0157000 protein n=2 Tax=Oryza sativa subsp. japonica TaxID=39947 RepID=Q0DKK7_ORYSJ|nr:unknown protein [Oryza sativa Japonica Group]KAB8098198.1 hypothetical protein EE612_027231 [Oryza sativa]BAF16616.1 Os05g0157000 [Oryza sativa Japonica Group]BAS92370.1 Os05g0157000 [Oryza sativa Japonica Group]|eukprot:NP_001054702.1 Os05g0157000 [Oryza sativa Japonica Group]